MARQQIASPFDASESPEKARWSDAVTDTINAIRSAGAPSFRPTRNLYIGQPYFDQVLGHPIWWQGSQWVDATGAPV